MKVRLYADDSDTSDCCKAAFAEKEKWLNAHIVLLRHGTVEDSKVPIVPTHFQLIGTCTACQSDSRLLCKQVAGYHRRRISQGLTS